jgi:multiple sugar transport system substrate-binding protein
MAKRNGLTRRGVLGATAAGAVVLGGGRVRRALAAPPTIAAGTKFTYWGGLIFSDKANKLLVDTINQWGSDNKIPTEVVMVSQNDTVQKVSAAIESNTMPDALDVGLDLLLVLAKQKLFVPVDKLYADIAAAQGGWLKAVDLASDTTPLAGNRLGIPFGVSGNMLHRRNDVLTKAGFPNAAKTWEELSTQAAKAQKPPLYGLGLALSNVGDGNTQIGVLQSYGGRIADDSGKKAAIKSDQTRTYLKWVKDAWDKKLFPPGNTTWDGAGDNNAYLSGQAIFIANTGSVGIQARIDDKDLYDTTLYSSLPGGPVGVISPIGPQLRVIPKSSKNPEVGLALFEYLARPEFVNAYYQTAIYGPVLNGQAKMKAFDGSDPILAGLLDLAQKGTAPGYPDVYNPAYADMSNNFIVPKMIQRVVIDNWDFDRAMDEAQTQIQVIYDKYKA